mmetsp:Transcript_28256/g.56583  ORF Transcript_28256/g.56583 Transcript_28256/m.56583 type:complete len:748 (-) Transcript_28256:129-2372(-)
MKISESAIVAMSLTAFIVPRRSSAFSAVSSSSSNASPSPLPSPSSSSSWRRFPRSVGTSLSVGKGARDLGLLTDTPLSDADQERINEKMAIEEVKDFLRSLPYRVAGKTKAGTPVYGSGSGSGDGFVSMGDFAVDASRSAELGEMAEAMAEAEAGEAITTATTETTTTLPKLRTALGSSVLLSRVLRPSSSSSSSSSLSDALLLLNLLNANSLVEDSPANFRFDVIAASVPPDDVASAKKKVVSREARYNGLLDKLRVLPEETSGALLPAAEELRGTSSWIVRLTKEEATRETVAGVSELLAEADELKNAVVLVEGVESEAEGADFLTEVGWDDLRARCVDLGKKCTFLLVGELYDGDASNLYHVAKLEVDVASATAVTTTSAVTTSAATTATATANDASSSSSSPSSKLSRKEAYRILASALSLESTANTSLYLNERPRTLDATTAAVSVDPFEELFPFPTYTGGPDDDDAWLAYKKECYAVQEKRKEARIEAEKTLGREKAEALEEEQALRAVEGKLPKEGVLEDRLIVGMREMGFSRTMELDVLVDSGVLAYKKYIAKPTPLSDQSTTDQPQEDEEWNQPSPEEILIITKNKKRKQEAATLIQSIAYEWARRKYWETEIQGDLMLYDPIAEKEYVANLNDEAMAFATEYYNKEYKMGRDQAEFEKFKEEKARQVEEREKAIFDKVKRKMLAEMDVDMFATIENLANIESEKKKAEYKYGQEVEFWWIGDPEDPERYQGVNVGPR